MCQFMDSIEIMTSRLPRCRKGLSPAQSRARHGLEGHHEAAGSESTFTLTNRVSWEMMLQAVYAAFRVFCGHHDLRGRSTPSSSSRARTCSPSQAGNIRIEAASPSVVKEPILIVFYNQLHQPAYSVRQRPARPRLRGSNKIVGPIVDIKAAMEHENLQGYRRRRRREGLRRQ